MSGARPLVVVGDALLDRDLDGSCSRVAPDAPVPVVDSPVEASRPGGAGLAAVLAARDGGRDVVLVTALADDDAARSLRTLLAGAGVDVVDLGAGGRTAEKVRVRAAGQTVTRLDYGGSATERIGALTPAARAAVEGAAAVLVADYGRGLTACGDVRDVLSSLPRRVPRVWDPHPRGAPPVAGVWLATPNRAEARRFAPGTDGDSVAADTARARRLRHEWSAIAVAVTSGPAGALVVQGDGEPPLVVPCRPATGDPCGAGDRFAVAATSLLADGAVPSEAVVGAVAAASAFVAAGGVTAMAAFREFGAPEPTQLTERTGGAGGTVVATGGCFDLLHAGHVATLEGARALGDRLVVLLNSDESVRRLKGDGRPVNTAGDRVAVLRALGCVDDVIVFDEDTPVAALESLRPDVFVKGGDYSATSLPESAVMARWGGEVVVLPYVEGRSTTRLLAEVMRCGSP